MISNAALLHSLISNLEDVSGYDQAVHSPVDGSIPFRRLMRKVPGWYKETSRTETLAFGQFFGVSGSLKSVAPISLCPPGGLCAIPTRISRVNIPAVRAARANLIEPGDVLG
jgi:hypothetical protein